MSTSSNNQQPSLGPGKDRAPLRHPSLDGTTHMWIAMVVLIPIIFTVILCIITACIYRYRKRRAQQNTINSPTTPNDQHNEGTATIIHNSQHNPFTMEELPPSYDLISERKKDPQITTGNNNTNEQFHLEPIKTEAVFTAPPSYNSVITDPTT